jgi:hypothetical protein
MLAIRTTDAILMPFSDVLRSLARDADFSLLSKSRDEIPFLIVQSVDKRLQATAFSISIAKLPSSRV